MPLGLIIVKIRFLASSRHLMTSSPQSLDPKVEYDSSNIDGGLIYYSCAYGRFLEKLLGGERNYLFTGLPERPCSLFPILIKDGPFGPVVNSLPFFGSHGAPIAARSSLVRPPDLLQSLEGAIAEARWTSVTVVENPLAPLTEAELNSLAFLREVDRRVSQITHWTTKPPNSIDELLSIFHVKTRNAIRKGALSGQEVVSGSTEHEWEFLISQHQQAILGKGGAAKSKEVFQRLRDSLPQNLRLHCGYIRGELVSALLTLRYGSSIEYFVPVVRTDFREKQVLSHLIAEVMYQDFREGSTLWNWGGTWNSQAGVMRFKSRFGATSRTYRYLNWCDPSLIRMEPYDLKNHYAYWYTRRYDA